MTRQKPYFMAHQVLSAGGDLVSQAKIKTSVGQLSLAGWFSFAKRMD